MGQVAHHLRHHLGSSDDLLCALVFYDINCQHPQFVHAQVLTSTQLNFWSFAFLFVASAVALNYWIRLRYLNTYSQLKEPPLVKPDVNALHPDVNTTEPPSAFHNYLDDFLQAVRVFGFLEKPVSIALLPWFSSAHLKART